MMNPVLRREAVTTMRGWKNFAVLTFYISVTALAAGLFIYGSVVGAYDFSFDPRSMVYLYALLCGIQLGLVMLSVPALTAGSISGERERQTLDLLLVTRMSSFSIVVGKLLSSMVFVLLLIFSTLPVFGIVFYFGAVGILDIFAMMAFILSVAFMAGAISIFFSCVYKKTVISIMLVYVLLGCLCVGTILLAVLPTVFELAQDSTTISPWRIVLPLVANPGAGFLSLMEAQIGVGFDDLSYYLTAKDVLLKAVIENLWVANIIFNIVIGGLFTLLAASRVNPIKGKRDKKEKVKKEKRKKKDKNNIEQTQES